MRSTTEQSVDTPVPMQMAVRECFADLVGKELEVGFGAPALLPYANDSAYAGLYVTDRNALGAIAVVDLNLAGALGGALALIPVATVNEGLAQGVLPETVTEGLFEVLNVGASLFNIPNAPHLKLGSMIGPGDKVPLDVLALSNALGRRLDMKMTVTGYGQGNISFIVNR